MTQTYVSLDWRRAPSASESIGRIQRLLTELDAKDRARVRCSKTRGQVSLVERDGFPPVLLRKSTTTLRKGRSQLTYWARMFSMALTITELLMDKQQVMSRFVEYKEVDPRTRMTMAQTRRILYDLALTIEVHPIALGVIPESNGQVTMPEHVGIEATIVTDIIRYHQEDTKVGEFTAKRIFTPGQTAYIPPLLRDLKIIGKGKQGKAKPRAVVVVEHRNLKMVLTHHDFADGKVILIMTSGFPSGATREFLHMLAQDPVLSDVPFLYLSDHDFQGVQMFQVLKYGAVASAYASDILVCSRLIWTGPSKEELRQSPMAYREMYMAQYRSDFKRKSDQEVVKAADAWQEKMSNKIEKKLVKTTKKDREMVKAFERLGWLEHEPDLKDEVKLMFEAPSKFRLADLSQVNVRYLRTFVQQKVQVFTAAQTTAVATAVKVQPVVLRSPTVERYKALPSQVSSMPVEPSSEIDEKEARLLLTEELS